MSNTSFRIVVAGCGGIAQAWLEPLSKRADVAIVGLVDLDPKRAAERAAAFAPQAATGSDLAAMIDRVHPDIVVDLTIPDAHADVACLALGKGCHVLSEKPLASSMDGARRILAAARAAGRTHAVMQNRRYLPGIRRLRQALADPALGRLAELHADFFIGAHFGGFRDAMRHVLLLDMAVHTVDQARYIGDLTPVAVNALEWNPPGSWYAHDASALVCVECAGGMRFTYRGSWCSEGRNTSWECTWRAVCTGGTAQWDGGDGFAIEAVEASAPGFSRPRRAVDAPPPIEMALQAHAGCIDDMLTSIRAGRQPMTCGEDNIRSLAIVHAAIASAERSGARVRIDEI
ncbi:MAG: Gfo/Idh/MocA family oxidoreductase [Planctomycetes bacterium]|nr:Gfo/Idh/MocA family oxidoreductase [Planctomycetota bacterium]